MDGKGHRNKSRRKHTFSLFTCVLKYYYAKKPLYYSFYDLM